ncbi:RIP metalloprotease RseP [Roseovarius faecimaris]|uniref:Zinc metalloprotease n=1 Tax=Roseovarius faecimaris TaxID=2494550 RepID=A0A6I6IN93_9RHOB|nr:RIP metalloprotease RseP [Roseovarius faecimaris]QGX98580.1 RIP metalloprotease RseP [Roseovarius faecimaris]
MDAIGLLPQFGSLFMTIAAFIVALSVIVAVHEYGHYIVGRWTGIKADVFSLGFGPVLFSRVDRHGTKWQFALLPFGGYVKFKGDSNAASANTEDTTLEMSPEERRQTMLGAPLWARTLTVAAGPVFNFILSVIVFGTVMFADGKTAEPLVVEALKPLPVQGVELQPGDQIITVAGVDLPPFDDREAFEAFSDSLPPAPLLEYRVVRDGDEMMLQGPHPWPPIASQLAPRSAAYAVDMRPGDVITAIDGAPIYAFSELKEIVESSKGRVLEMQVWRDGEVLDFALKPKRSDEPQEDGGFVTHWRIGIAGGFAFEAATEPLGPFEALSGGVTQTISVVTGSLSGLYHMITGAISSCNMSGPIGIAQVSGAMASQGIDSFIWFIAVLSAAVGLLNLMPIPILDGGHLVFYGYEAVFGKPPSEKALRVLMTVGLTLVLSLMVFAVTNDLFCP